MLDYTEKCFKGLEKKKKENKVRERRRKDCTEKRIRERERERERDEKWCEDKTQYVDSSKPYK